MATYCALAIVDAAAGATVDAAGATAPDPLGFRLGVDGAGARVGGARLLVDPFDEHYHLRADNCCDRLV